ncbi:MAG: asparagine synthase (glutamine-hydrolyzing) [Gammaproteobacteria bacterium]|nr:asparagine synthase (glutamine-hydrolyzing) [Gammaproteobacteria bacterium]
MCGIAGLVVSDRSSDLAATLRRMANSIAHRGPDDEGFFQAVTRSNSHLIGLAHRRLSIIDLDAGHQPMSDTSGTLHVVYNGEIYNFRELRADLIERGHQFSTSCDTEVILYAFKEYGEACVDHLNGMFAFAIWDANDEILFIARDRFGKKPLFIYQANGILAFGSEIKALLQVHEINSEVDMLAVWDYLAYRYTPGPRTLFSNIYKLSPGTVAVWQNGQLKKNRYYSPPDKLPRIDTMLPEDPVRTFTEQLDQAVKARMVSDVAYGAFLSGGIDSSAIVALMSRHSTSPVKTFSVGFRDQKYSELNHARVIADQFGTDHHELLVSEQDVIDQLPKLVRFRDAPVSEPSDIPIYLLSVNAANEVKMVLTGEGSDELLAGYPKHVFERYVSSYQKLPVVLRQGLLEPLVDALPYRFSRAKTAVRNLGLSEAEERLPRWFGALSDSERAELVAFRPPTAHNTINVQFDANAEDTTLRRILYFDQTSWLPDNLLERGDRMTMAASLEARMPFMDHRLYAYMSALPDRYRLRGRQTKWILRQAMKQLLPAHILKRPKVGFKVPVNKWFQGTLRGYLMDHLTGPDSKTAHYYRRNKLDEILRDHVEGRRNHEKLLWGLLNLELWHRQYFGTEGLQGA